MRIIISPAKKMRVDPEGFEPENLPQFLEQTQQLKDILQGMSPPMLQKLWNCNDSIAQLNVERLQNMDLFRRLTPAVLSYEGIQYQYMAPTVFEDRHLSYIGRHLRILSGFYGLLRPFDGVTPYRLEMQARFSPLGYRDLYDFWGSRLADQLATECDLVLNLASLEYSRAVQPHLPGKVRFLTCRFLQPKGEKLQQGGTQCKMARGQMVRWMAENSVTRAEDIHDFEDLGYRFSPSLSSNDCYTFLKGGV